MKEAIGILIVLIATGHLSIGQNLPIPTDYTIVDSVSGDLDQDAVPELVVAFNKGPDNKIDGVPRQLVIYKLKNNKWTEWKTSDQALYGSLDGGMMGDPFGSIEIKGGILHIVHTGGSSWKWSHTDKYRFQNGEFYLIGYTEYGGKPCENWREVDFNLSTGKMIVKKEYEKCEEEETSIYKAENETLYNKGLSITIQERQQRLIIITTPEYGHEIYISIGEE